jgi:hypothetical protein
MRPRVSRALAAFGNLELGEALGHPADHDVDRLRRLHLVAEEEQRVEAAVAALACWMVARVSALGNSVPLGSADRLALGIAEQRLAAAVVVEPASPRRVLVALPFSALRCSKRSLRPSRLLGHLRGLLAHRLALGALDLEPHALVDDIALAGLLELEGVGAGRAHAGLALLEHRRRR